MTIKLIDTHAHLDFPKLFDQLDDVIAQAQAEGIQRIVTIGASRGLESNYRALEIAQSYPFIRCTAGIHPHDAGKATEEMIACIANDFAGLPEVVAIGEAGLDYHYDYAPKEIQKDVFRKFIRIAQEVDKPIVIHSRSAEEDTIAILREEGIRGGILHCFTGSKEMAEQALDLDFYISFSGIVTFKNGRDLLEIAANIPADRILVETDSPYLAPIPYRGKTNQPGYVRHIAEKIAQARGMTLEEFATLSWQNAARVFRWAD